MRACLLLLVATAGCGKVSLSADAGPSGDAAPGNLLDPIAGTWSFWLDNETDPSAQCTVTFDTESFDVYCPSAPTEVTPGCMEVKDDVHLYGSWGADFQGTADTITRYEGDTCEGAGFAPVGEDIVDEGFFTMTAAHEQPSAMDGFLNLAYGVWQWTGDDGTESLGCSATFGPADGEVGVTFRVECPEDPTISNMCTTTAFVIVEGVLTASSMTAEGWNEDRNEGEGCTEPPVVEGERTPMGATRM